MTDLLRVLQDLVATCTSAGGMFECGFVLIPAIVLLGFLFTFASALLTGVARAVRWSTARLDSKACPRCGETVRRRAAVCRFCSYTFTDVPPPP